MFRVQLRVPAIRVLATAACNEFFSQKLNEPMRHYYSLRGSRIETQRQKANAQKLYTARNILARAVTKWRDARERKYIQNGALLLKSIVAHMYALATAVLQGSIPHGTTECQELLVQVISSVVEKSSSTLEHFPLTHFKAILDDVIISQRAARTQKREREFERWGVIEPSALKRF